MGLELGLASRARARAGARARARARARAGLQPGLGLGLGLGQWLGPQLRTWSPRLARLVKVTCANAYGGRRYYIGSQALSHRVAGGARLVKVTCSGVRPSPATCMQKRPRLWKRLARGSSWSFALGASSHLGP